MAIKTDELQQAAALSGADTLLMADSAGGTAQLSLDRLKAFTLGQTSVPARTVEKAAADLPDYIAGLPRLLAERLTVKVSGTLTADALLIDGFYGPGSLYINAEADGDAVFKNQTQVANCGVPVYFTNIRFQDPAPGSTASRNSLTASEGSVVQISGCSFSSSDGGHNQNYRALCPFSGSVIYAVNLSAANCGAVVLAAEGGIAVCIAASADALHDNATGAYVWYGGIVILCDNTPDAMGGASNMKSGGFIVKSNGTLL